MRWWRRYPGSRLLETRNRQGSWEVTLYTLLPRVLHGFYDAKRQHLSTIKTDGDLSFTIIQQQTYRRKHLLDQPDDNSLTALRTKRAQVRFCEIVNTCTERREEKRKRIQRTAWILSHVLRKRCVNMWTASTCVVVAVRLSMALKDAHGALIGA